MSPPTLCRFIQKHPRLSQVIDEVVEETCDIAIGQLVKKLQDGDMQAIKYYLDNKGQAKGFGVRKLAFRDGEGNVAVPAVLITEGKMSEEEWLRRFAPKTD